MAPNPKLLRRLLLGVLGLTVCLVSAAPALAGEHGRSSSPNLQDVPVVHLDGRGHGHGVGLSQWGAYTLAANGATAAEILDLFYPGTSAGSVYGEVRVIVDTRPAVRVSLPQGGQLRSARDGAQAAGFPIQLAPGEIVEIVHDGSGYRVIGASVQAQRTGRPQQFGQGTAAGEDDCILGVCSEPEPSPQPDAEPEPEPCQGLLCEPTPTAPTSTTTTTTTTTTTPDDHAGAGAGDGTSTSTTTPPPPDAPRSPTPIWAIPNGGGTVSSFDRGRTYRGAFEVVGGPGELRIRNHVDVEDYLKGMAEVPSTWPPAAIRAQTVAARTYALRAVAARGELCDSEACQVYVGVTRETGAQTEAVEATRGWVVTYRGALASTFYSASGGGFTATVQEGFGASYDVPYLQAHPYATDNPQPWAVDVALSDVGARLGYPGQVTDVRVTATGPSGRPIAMELDGDAGTVEIDPQQFRRQLGLRSTLFTASVGVADEAPPPPPPAVADQLSTEAGTDQLDAVVVEGDLVDPDLDEVATGLSTRAAAATTGTGSATDGTVTTALAMLLVAAGTITGHRLHAVGAATGADGLDGSVLGAPMGAVRQTAATLWRWRARRG